jgi:cytochrome c biogenesis protein CcmG, thiol:disulfide interchange protein DsbE
MRKYLRPGNLIFFLILGFVLFQQIPILKNSLEQTNKPIVSREMKVLNHKSVTLFPPPGPRAIAIFWASWCGPCKLEMNRLKSSVESGAIPRESIFAINPFETDSVSRKFIAENNYPFNFLEASPLAREIGVAATPTTIFIDKGIITHMSSGMSLWGIWRAEFFLK